METTIAFCSQIHRSLSANLHHHSLRRRHKNVRRQPNFTMPLRDLTLRRITANQYHLRFNHVAEAFCISNHLAAIHHHTMAEESKNKDVVRGKADPPTLNVSKSKAEQDQASGKSTPVIPPPPEKPLPGDCCGSGCVRCVWDVYYEELEEYNSLYKADSKTT